MRALRYDFTGRLLTTFFVCVVCSVLFDGSVFSKRKADVSDYLVFAKDKTAVPAQTEAVKKRTAKLIELTSTDHIALLKMTMKHYDETVHDYRGKFIKQEVVGGKLLKPQSIEFRFKEKPFSVFMAIKKNAGSANKVLFVEGKNDDKMVVHPTGLFAWIKSVKREPTCEAAMKENRYPCTKFGFKRMMKKAMTEYEAAAKAGDLTVKYLGITVVDGRRCVTGERLLPKGKGYENHRLIVQIDIETLMPVDVRSFDWEGKLLTRYSYSDLDINVGLKDADFTKKACGL